MATVVYRPKNKYAQNKPNNQYEYKNLNKRIDLLISRVDTLLNKL